MKKIIAIIPFCFLGLGHQGFAQQQSKWSYDLGISLFKSSLRNQPDELLYNPVFEKWEYLNHHPEAFSVTEYTALSPYAFNLSIGIDGMFRYRKYLMIKLGYCYTNTLGIGGKGNISYTDISSGLEYTESKEMAFTSHQLNYFIGPVVPLGEEGAEIFMGFSMMSPTFVSFREQYRKSESGTIVREYSHHYTGFFGNCRSVIGIQVPLRGKFKFGTEMVYSYFNGIRLKSGTITDDGFKFPEMQWNFTFRYHFK